MGFGIALLGFFDEVIVLSAAPEGQGAYAPGPSNPDAGQAEPTVPTPDSIAAAPVFEWVIPSPMGGGGFVFDPPPRPPVGGEAEDDRLPEPPVGGTAS